MKVKTAVIFAAGFGSRMLPVTQAVQKELLPILDRPIVDYVVADLVAAGIKRVIFVIQSGSHGLQDYYVGNAGLQNHLKRFGKKAALANLQAIHRKATFEFVEQPVDAGYGTGVAILAAVPHLPENEAVVVCGGDDFLWHADGTSETARLIQTFQSSKAIGALMALERPSEELFRYGVLDIEQRDRGEYLREFVEKPAPGDAPSNLINISKYILTPELLGYLTNLQPDPKSGELYITDAIREAAMTRPVAVHRAGGRFLDAGSVNGWLEANLIVAQSREDVSVAFKPTKSDGWFKAFKRHK